MDFTALNIVILTLFIILAIGFLCRKTGIIDDHASKKMSKLILAIGQPAMLIYSLSSAEYSEENVKMAGAIIVIGFIFHAILALIAFLIALPFKKLPDDRKVTEFALIFANCAFIGFPIFEALIPGKGLFMASFLVVSFNILLWTLGLGIFARGRTDVKITVKKVLVNFGTIPCLIGFILFLLKNPAISFEMPEFFTKAAQYLMNLCTPISLLITGSLIAVQSPKKIFGTWQLYYFNIIKLVALPLLVCVITKLINLPQPYAIFLTAAAALPSASATTMMAETYDVSPGYASLTVGTSSLLSILTIPLTLTIAQYIFSL